MIPYADPSYFLLILYPLLGLIGLGLAGRLGRRTVLVTSLALVAFQYGDPLGNVAAGFRTLGVLVLYACGSIATVRTYAGIRARRPPGRAAFRVAIALVLVPLVATKTAPARSTVSLGIVDTLGFLGMSYMTLRVLDVLIVLHDGVVVGVPRIADLASYFLFAPSISAGPIDRFVHFTGQLEVLPKSRRAYARDLEAGIHRIAQGLLYKFIIAALIEGNALARLATRTGTLAAVGYMYAYSLYLFFDFAGYSAFAIGVGRLFGIEVPENFDAPFRSRSFREIWNRWHITLSWWLRDHVYMRFVLTAARRRWFGGDRVRAHHLGLLLTMALMGCWHGLAPRYVVYGLYQGGMLVLYDVVGRWSERRAITAEGRLAQVLLGVVTMHLFAFGLLIFSGRLGG